MSVLNEAQKDVKITYLTQENEMLRAKLLDLQIITGQIAFKDENGEDTSTGVDEDQGDSVTGVTPV